MAKHVRRIGLVELHVELPQRAAADLNALVRQAAARDTSRAGTVKSILASKKLHDVDVLVFPGWTLRGRNLPLWVTELSGGRTVVIELDDPEKTNGGGKGNGKRTATPDELRSTYVVQRDGAVLTAQQQFVVAKDADDDRCRDLVAILSSATGGRTFHDAKLGRVGLVICGEVNVVSSRHGPTQLPKGFPLLDIILNPAHTPSPLQAMRQKRRRLSIKTVVATTANVYSQWNRNGKTGARASKAAEVFANGAKIDRDERNAITFDGAKVLVFDIPARESIMCRSAGFRGPRS